MRTPPMRKETKIPETPASTAALNRFRFFSFAETAEIFGVGQDLITECVRLGAPVVARKMNPAMFKDWLREHWNDIPKLG